MKRKIITVISLFIAISLFCAVSTVSGEEYKAMKGIESAKAVFDERESNPKNAALLLEVIHQTFKELAAMKKNPVFVVVFIGPSVKFSRAVGCGHLRGTKTLGAQGQQNDPTVFASVG